MLEVQATKHPDTQALVQDLCSLAGTYLDEKQVQSVREACLFGIKAHEGQTRRSGEPYIHHPFAVARILANIHLDCDSIIAAILHDVIEDTGVTKNALALQFGNEVAELVDGVTKLTQIKFENRLEAQAENFRKMMLAMVHDIRVILIKLADRLHNMRTLGAMPAEKSRRIAHETLEIYVPIAYRLGINSVRTELQDLGFKALHPMRYRVINDAVKKVRGHFKELVGKIENTITVRLKDEGIEACVQGRVKHLHSIYRKMQEKQLSFSDVFDVYAFRIIVDEPDTCYRVLGIIHSIYKPVPGRFKDYIAIPKTNGYQSLHTILFSSHKVPIEVQIRTKEMDKVAEAGIAAHWLYKTKENPENSYSHHHVRDWLHNLLELQRNTENSLDFIENVKVDLFPDKVYVFTPNGDIIELPRGSTLIDFAYAVHTDIGNHCISAKVDRRTASLRTVLHNGQTIEVITSPNARPNPVWINFAVTGKARSNIHHYLKNLKHDDAIILGERLLDQALHELGFSLINLTPAQISILLKSFNFKSMDDLLAEIGLGNCMAILVARRLQSLQAVEKPDRERRNKKRPRIFKNVFSNYMPTWLRKEASLARPLAIRGTEGMVINFAKCCDPIPGDPIVAQLTAGRGIVIHTEICKNMAAHKRPENCIDVHWERQVEGEFPVEIHIEVINQRGVLATISTAISEQQSNINNVEIDQRDESHSLIKFTITVRNRKHLATIMRRIRRIKNITRIYRAKK